MAERTSVKFLAFLVYGIDREDVVEKDIGRVGRHFERPEIRLAGGMRLFGWQRCENRMRVRRRHSSGGLAQKGKRRIWSRHENAKLRLLM